jgi:hypothetical protein
MASQLNTSSNMTISLAPYQNRSTSCAKEGVTKTVEEEMKMKKGSTIAWGFGIAVLITGCAAQSNTREQALQQPIYCDTAEGDIRVLQSEKNTTAQQAAAGVTSILPAGIVVGLATGTTGTRARVATGQYNRMIDERIEEIKKTCGM